MVRISRRSILREHRRTQAITSKTGISHNDTLNKAIATFRQEAQQSGSGANPSGNIPRLAKKLDQIEKSGAADLRKEDGWKREKH